MKDIWEFEEHPIRVGICYTESSIKHPAKGNLSMFRKIIKLYSNPGELILDPMAGIGTTIIEGILLGRNVIGIEYEQKFVDMAKENIKLVNKNFSFMKSLGKGVILKGDSRDLVNVLAKGGEKIILSGMLPFANREPFQDKEWRDKNIPRKNASVSYSENKKDIKNIGNLDYKPLENGLPDCILFSPPFSNANTCGNKGQGTKQKIQWEKNKVKGGSGFLNKVYSESKDNIGNMEYGKKGAGMAKKEHPNHIQVYGNLKRTSGNIENMPYVDSIISSPPYAHESTTNRESVKSKRDIHSSRFNETNYSNDPLNCRNLKGQSYLSEMKKIYENCFLILKKGGLMILVLKNFVRAGKTVRLDLDTISLCQKCGFKLINRHYRKIKNPSFWITNAIIKWKKKHPDIPHPYPLMEDILVFKKTGDIERESSGLNHI